MKKVIYGGVLFFTGMFMISMLILGYVINPYEADKFSGFLGHITGTSSLLWFVLAVIISISGFVICRFNAKE